jgi:methylmalonyl-CoA/ethylmalonyl-CoA epimerase
MAETPILPKVTCQVAIAVPDIEAAAQAWAKVLGVPVPPIRTTDPEEKSHIRYNGQPTPARAKLAFFALDNISLELIEPIDGPSTWRDQVVQHGPSLHHLAFKVADTTVTSAQLQQAVGAQMVQRGDFTGGCYAYCDATKTLGAVIELLASTPAPAK